MKAEHRKELQTNSLADFLGRTVRRARSGPQIPWFWLFAAFLVVIVVLGFFWIRRNRALESADAWAKIEYNDRKSLQDLDSEFKDTKQGQAARFTLAYSILWDGIRLLGGEDAKYGVQAAQFLDAAKQIFTQLAEECKDDNERLAEAKYHLAVTEEAMACIKGPLVLEDAKKRFEELTRGDLANTPYGALAKKRFDQYNNLSEYAAIIGFYTSFRNQAPVRTGQ